MSPEAIAAAVRATTPLLTHFMATSIPAIFKLALMATD